jgi:transcription elongation GreA/GreB family factor
VSDGQLLFLADDFEHLQQSVEAVREQIRLAKRESSESVEQSSESWHDNFTFEEAQRQLRMLLNHLGGLSKMLERAEIVRAPRNPDRADVGTRVRFRDTDTGREDEIVIGSAMVGPSMAERGNVSYLAPLGALLYRGRTGERRVGNVAGRRTEVEIVAVLPFVEGRDVTEPGRQGP